MPKPHDDPTATIDSSSCSSITDLSKARLARPLKLPNGQLLPPWTTYTPAAPYLVWPCRVITLPIRAQASLDKK